MQLWDNNNGIEQKLVHEVLSNILYPFLLVEYNPTNITQHLIFTHLDILSSIPETLDAFVSNILIPTSYLLMVLSLIKSTFQL